jgi:hypothetical protein
VAAWLAGPPAAVPALAGALRSYWRFGLTNPAVGSGGGAPIAALLAAGTEPTRLPAIVDGLMGTRRPWRPFRPAGRPTTTLAQELQRILDAEGVRYTGDLRVPFDHGLYSSKLQIVLCYVPTGEVVVLPRDAARFGFDPDRLPVAMLVAAALTSAHDTPVEIDGRRFCSAHGLRFDPGPWFAGPPGPRRFFVVDVADRSGVDAPRRFPSRGDIVRVTIPHLAVEDDDLTIGRRQRAVLVEIGRETAARALRRADAERARGHRAEP